jgi:hypothetical protein
VGDVFTVSVSFPESIPDSAASSEFGSYRAFRSISGVSATYQVNGNSFSVPVTNFLDVFVADPAFSGRDRFEFEAFISATPGTGGFFNLFLGDPAGTALTSDGLPASLQLSSFSSAGSNLILSSEESFQGSITSFTYTSIPEPSSTMALLLGMLGVLAAVRVNASLARRAVVRQAPPECR